MDGLTGSIVLGAMILTIVAGVVATMRRNRRATTAAERRMNWLSEIASILFYASIFLLLMPESFVAQYFGTRGVLIAIFICSLLLISFFSFMEYRRLRDEAASRTKPEDTVQN